MNGTLFNLGPMEVVVIMVLALLVLGPERLPGIMRGLGRTIRKLREIYVAFVTEFREELQPIADEVDTITRELQGELAAIREATDFRSVLAPVLQDINAGADLTRPVPSTGPIDAPAWGDGLPPAPDDASIAPPAAVEPPEQSAEAADETPAAVAIAEAAESAPFVWDPKALSPFQAQPEPDPDPELVEPAPSPFQAQPEPVTYSAFQARPDPEPVTLSPFQAKPEPVRTWPIKTQSPIATQSPLAHARRLAPYVPDLDADNPWQRAQAPVRADRLDDDSPWRQ